MMKPLINLLFLAFMPIILIIGCEKDDNDVFNVVTLDLITDDNPNFFAKTVILFEDEDYLIKTNFDTYISSYPFDVLQKYDEIKMQVIEDSKNQDTLLMTDYILHPVDSTYILIFHLENGSCLIFDKMRNKIIPTIKRGEWEDYSGSTAIGGGRKFFINNKLFIEVYDWIN